MSNIMQDNELSRGACVWKIKWGGKGYTTQESATRVPLLVKKYQQLGFACKHQTIRTENKT